MQITRCGVLNLSKMDHFYWLVKKNWLEVPFNCAMLFIYWVIFNTLHWHSCGCVILLQMQASVYHKLTQRWLNRSILYLMYTKMILWSFYNERPKYSRLHLIFLKFILEKIWISFCLSKVHFSLDSFIHNAIINT